MKDTETQTELSPEDHAESIVRASGTSFYWAMRRLPKDKRAAMYAIYAFCREIDDIADDPGDEDEKRLKLGQWRSEILRLYADDPRTPIGKALQGPVDRFGLRQEDFGAVIAGMEMDAGARVRIADMDELVLYCDRVASAVGRLSTRVFGLPPELGDKLAFAQGQALQLTNILRDVDEDATRDRLYLPGDVLLAHGIEDTKNLDSVIRHPQLHQVCELLGDIAVRRFAEARAMIALCDRETVRPAVMMLEVYNRILERLMKTGWETPRKRVSLPTLTKLWVMFRYGIL